WPCCTAPIQKLRPPWSGRRSSAASYRRATRAAGSPASNTRRPSAKRTSTIPASMSVWSPRCTRNSPPACGCSTAFRRPML
ncbi:MAG: hypothetical protein AVDCRST_MAG04-1628, partial [uncultured Acetobacteraceae bacterium]